VLTAAPAFGINVTSLIALLSVAGLAVSLALQNTLSNLAGDIMVLLSKPFEVGDFIESEGVTGTVTGVDLAYTTVVTVDNKEVFVPNSHISAAKITNFNRLGKRRVDLNFTASYDAPTATVKKAIQEVVDAQSSMILTDPAPVVLLSAYLNSSIQYTVRVWVDAADYWTVYGNINEGVRESFARHNVEMTYEHVNVHLVKE
jgi:small conductance mechanosensitive channel